MYFVNSDDELEDLDDMLPLPDSVGARTSPGDDATSFATSLPIPTDEKSAVSSQNGLFEKPDAEICADIDEEGKFATKDCIGTECEIESPDTSPPDQAAPSCKLSTAFETTAVAGAGVFNDCEDNILELNNTGVEDASRKDFNFAQSIEVSTKLAGPEESVQHHDDYSAFKCEQAVDDGAGRRSLDNLSSRSDWITGMPLVGSVQTRCGSSLSNYSGRSTPLSHRSVRPASSLSSLHQHKVQCSQQHHDLRHAALGGHVDNIARLLKAGISVDQTLRQGWTALMFACSSAQPEAVKVLLDNGADPNFHKELFTPLMAVCASSVRDVLSESRCAEARASSEGPDVRPTSGAKMQHPESVEPPDGKPGISSSEVRLLSCMELVLSGGAAVNASERHRLTPLMFASKEGRVALVRRLIAAGALPNARDNKGWTALCWACYGGHTACAQELLAAAADAALSTAHHQTAADIARGRHHLNLAEIVEAAALGTPISAPESAHFSPLSSDSTCAAAPQHCSDLDMVLAGLGLSHLSAAFARHKIDLVSFLRLSAGELSELGIREVGVQHKLLSAIAEMHRKAWQPSSVAPLSSSPYISLSDATNMLLNVNKHVSFLEATLAFLRQQLESSPSSHHLHHNTTTTTIHTLIGATNDAAASINRLHSATLFLSTHLQKLSETAQHFPSDLVVCSGPDAPRVWTKTVVAGAAVGASAVVAVWWWFSPLVWAPATNSHTVLLDCN